MKILLDENFPLQLYHRLKSAGYAVEHIIVLGVRGIEDSMIRRRVETEKLVLLTQDIEFENIPPDFGGTVIISRVPQSLPIRRRTEIWFRALDAFLSQPVAGKLFDLLETGDVVPWRAHETR